jgi:uncharacterized protein YydD (DUF2326 family)
LLTRTIYVRIAKVILFNASFVKEREATLEQSIKNLKNKLNKLNKVKKNPSLAKIICNKNLFIKIIQSLAKILRKKINLLNALQQIALSFIIQNAYRFMITKNCSNILMPIRCISDAHYTIAMPVE